MLRLTAEEYRHRTPSGYPIILDEPERGVIGIALDPSYALYIIDNGNDVAADYYWRSPRTDARATASRAKFSGLPFDDRRVIALPVSDQVLRNYISELISRWNTQPGIIHITDT